MTWLVESLLTVVNQQVSRGGCGEAAVIEVAIGPGSAPGRFKVEVVRSPAGEASVIVGLPAAALLARRTEVQAALLASAAPARRPLRQAERPVREVGQALFTALLGTGEVAGLYRASAALAAERGQGLRVVLRIDTPMLAGLPWEAMYDQAGGGYVCRREQLVRHIPVLSAPVPLLVHPPLRILGVVASPRGLAALNVARERGLLTAALARPAADGLVELTWAPAATWADLHDVLLGEPWHVLHFIGHGYFDSEAGEGVLALTIADGRPDLIEASRFTDLLRQARPMPCLVVLNCCSGAATSATDLFAGTAAALTRAGIPAVAAMQFEVTDSAAAAFARGFYAAIAHGRGVDDAVSAGRIAILGSSSRTLEWLTPVLYLRGHHARLFTYPAAGTKRPGSGARAAPASQAQNQAAPWSTTAGQPAESGPDRPPAPARPPADSDRQQPATSQRRRLTWPLVTAAALPVIAAAIFVSVHGLAARPPGHSVLAAIPGTPIPVGTKPDWIAITPDGKTAYVANGGDATVTPISLGTNTPGRPIRVGNLPLGIAITPGGQTAYVANNGDGTVTPINLRTSTPGRPIRVGNHPCRIAITPNGSTAYVTNQGDNTVTPIDLATGTAGPPIPAGRGPQSIVITRDGHTAYVADQGTDTITPISLPEGTPQTPITVGYYPDSITLAADGQTAYTTDNGLETITQLNLAYGQARATIVISSPISIAITRDGRIAYVANWATASITPVRLPSFTFGTPIKVGSNPQVIAITPKGDTAYVVNNGDGTITPITLPPG